MGSATRETLDWPLQRAVELFPSHTAVVDGEERLDHAQLARRVAALDAGLAALGVGAGAAGLLT